MFKKIWRIISDAGTLWGFLPTTITAASTGALWLVAMTIGGYLQGIPLFYIMLAIPLAAAAIATFLLRASEWRQRITASGKLNFNGVALGIDFTRDHGGTPVGIIRGQVRLLLTSRAEFPLSFVIDDLHSSIQGRFPPHMPRADSGAIIAVGEVKTYSDHVIDMAGIGLPERLTGSADFKLKFGHHNREKYPMSKKIEFECVYDQEKRTYNILGHKEVP